MLKAFPGFMPAVYQLEYADGRKEEETFANGGSFYLISEHTFLKLHDIIAWCFDCQRLVSAEDVKPVAELEEDIRAMDMPESEGYRKTFGKRVQTAAHVAWWKYECERVLEWRRQRVSPASCLICGKRNILTFPNNEWISHPKTGEKCRLSCIGISSVGYRKYRYYDIEGNALTPSDNEYADLQVRRRSWEERNKLENPFPLSKSSSVMATGKKQQNYLA